ncbi:MAG: YraN family protein [Bacteroidetes bacterium]|nr:YraN family protein [Bacteroidota bacterium]
MSRLNKTVGDKGEQTAADFLSKNGFEILERNFRHNHYEIDLIVRKENLIVFCEVKTRRSDTYGPGEFAVDRKKQERIRKVAEAYVFLRELEEYEFRFDVVVVEPRGKTSKIRVIEDAF